MFIFSGLSKIFSKLTGKVVVDEKFVEDILNELFKILIQNDVEISLANSFIRKIREKCLKGEVPKGLSLREYVIKTIYEELVDFLGKEKTSLIGKRRIMLVGLYGSGKTTTCAKIARILQKQGLKPALVCLDYHRAAAPEQLMELGQKINVKVFVDKDKNPFKLAEEVLDQGYDSLIFDTAGRDALDKDLAIELKKLGEIINPDEVLLVIPADIGKVAGKQAREFNKLVGITGVVITRMDGTAKGGAALATCHATGAKVKFIGTGEKIDDLEFYDPKRFVSRLLGLGDLETLLEKAREVGITEEKAEKIIEDFTLEDFLEQFEALKKIGPLDKIVSFIPGLSSRIPKEMLEEQEKKLKVFKSIIQSMTREERRNPKIINASRIRRIARGSGRSEREVRELLSQYNQLKKILRKFKMSDLKKGRIMEIARQFGFNF